MKDEMPVKRARRPRGRPKGSVEREDARRLLLEAAAGLIAERGYRATTVNEVISRADLSKGTFYWHFQSKDDLLFALLDERIDQPIRELIERLRDAPAEEDMSVRASRVFLALTERDPETLLLEHEYRGFALREPGLRKRYLERQAELRDALAVALEARAQHLGAPPFAIPHADIATAYLALTHGLAIERLIDRETVPDALLGETVALIYQGLVARAERDR